MYVFSTIPSSAGVPMRTTSERKRSVIYSLTALKKESEDAWLNDFSCVPLQQSLRHQQTAFANFFAGRLHIRRSKANSTSRRLRSLRARLNTVYMAKSKFPLDIRWSRELPSAPSTVTISKDAVDRYFVSCLCEFEPVSMPVTAKTVGIDVGIKDLFVTDTGFKTGNPRHTTKYAKRLALQQRRLSRKKKAPGTTPKPV